jgi:putative inorganic carbon (HCO3(-)) transporter
VETVTDNREETRLNLWRSSVAGITARPLLGWGPGGFRDMLAEHEVPGEYRARSHSYNDLLMHGVNAGLLGIAAAVWLLVAIVRECHAGWRRTGAGSWQLRGAVAAVLGITAAGMFQVFQTDDEVEILLYLVLGCCLALSRILPAGDRLDEAPAATSQH